MAHWERSAALDSAYSVVWRNLGIAYFNVRNDAAGARDSFERAVNANPEDGRLRYERDQLWKRTGVPVADRLAELETRLDIVAQRDDLTVELVSLYNQTGQPRRAQALLSERRFQPWEGGEGAALGQFVRIHIALGREALERGNADAACELLQAALTPPENLGEAWHLLANRSNVYYWLGVAFEARDNTEAARAWWTKAAESSGDFQEMSVRLYSEMTYYSASALKRLGRSSEAKRMLRALLRHAKRLARTNPRIDYFATSLPAMLLFNDDLAARNTIAALFLEAQASVGLGYAKRAGRLVKRVLQLDPSHANAFDLISELRTEAILADRAGITA